MADRTCIRCEADISGTHGNQRYCSPACRGSAAYAKRERATCSVCGGITAYPASTAPPGARCKSCTRTPCGTAGAYGRGCRCDACREYNRRAMREYIVKVKARDGVTPRVKYRKTPDVHCADCGARLRFGGGGSPDGIAPRCLKCSRRRPHIPQSVRQFVYDRDGLVCQLCHEPTEPDSASHTDWYPTLDHVVMFSQGGTDDVGNLRTAHRWCNVARNYGMFEEVS